MNMQSCILNHVLSIVVSLSFISSLTLCVVHIQYRYVSVSVCNVDILSYFPCHGKCMKRSRHVQDVGLHVQHACTHHAKSHIQNA